MDSNTGRSRQRAATPAPAPASAPASAATQIGAPGQLQRPRRPRPSDSVVPSTITGRVTARHPQGVGRWDSGHPGALLRSRQPCPGCGPAAPAASDHLTVDAGGAATRRTACQLPPLVSPWRASALRRIATKLLQPGGPQCHALPPVARGIGRSSTHNRLVLPWQDLGAGSITFITTLALRAGGGCQEAPGGVGARRPNPVGRPVEGLTLRPGWESFVGAGALPMRHGLTMGSWHAGSSRRCASTSTVRWCRCRGWQPQAPPGHGWPVRERTWVNPSPNAPNLWMARCYPGSVMVEGTTLSEGRGTTRPLELLAPGSGCRGAAGADAGAGAGVAARLPAASLLV